MPPGSRPCCSANACRRRTPLRKRVAVFSGWRGLVWIGNQASPSRTVRRSAALLSPPTHTGTPGRCTGLGRNVTFENLKNSPSYSGASSLHSTRHASTISSVTRPRAANGGAWTALNSSSIQPAPTPKVNRPPDRLSMVATSFAVSMAPRWGTTVTEVSSRARVVIAARKARRVNCSMHSPDAAPGNAPESL